VADADVALTTALAGLSPPGVLAGHRVIAPRDGDALFPSERVAFQRSVSKVIRQSGAARIVARGLLGSLGYTDIAIPRSETGAPVWPSGVIGSLAHDEDVAVAAIARVGRFSGLGIDVEPAVPLPPGLSSLIATPAERRCYPPEIIGSRILFSIKESVYKALNPLDGIFLDFQDVEVDLSAHRAVTRSGRTIRFAFTTAPRVLAIAFA
jgi:4'-phosphopantetheinyl transferase EntD